MYGYVYYKEWVTFGFTAQSRFTHAKQDSFKV